ncbi:MAG: tRNA uridine-5-carboxymethylaminomethyl(34) synthesis GTPase MnmE [Pseudomonadota bacterium]
MNDIIAAIATPPGLGGVGIVRVSGPNLGDFVTQVAGSIPEARRARLLTLRDEEGNAMDSGLVLYFPAPASFTGEDVVEFHGHGGPVVMQLVLDVMLAAGARRAGPGEFTRRAFDNNKLDLAQAEAIADLIASGTEEAARAALRSLSGEFSARVHALVEALTQIRIYVEAAIDFPDEDIDFLSDAALTQRLDGAREAFVSLLESTRGGRLLRDGFNVVIAGKPNAGKSSLMNALSGDDTAIVTAIAGTTRDVLRETINLDGVLVELVDTAGLRDDAGEIEEEGIRRARRAMESADAIIWLVDDQNPDDTAPAEDIPVIRAFNKVDASGGTIGTRDDGSIGLSATTGDGLDSLKQKIGQLAGVGQTGEGTFTARQRHIDAIDSAQTHFELGVQHLLTAQAGDLLAEELRLAQRDLGLITGELPADELLGRIFADFCIGK